MHVERRTGMGLPKGCSCLALIIALLLSACSGTTLFHKFTPVENGQWLKNDTLAFQYRNTGNGIECSINADVRLFASYPYKDLLIHVQVATVSNEIPLLSDTLVCSVYDDGGRRLGSTAGLLYQVSSNSLRCVSPIGEPVVIKLSHIMECDTLCGVSDAGIRIVAGN